MEEHGRRGVAFEGLAIMVGFKWLCGIYQVAMPVIELKKKVMGPVLTVSMLAKIIAGWVGGILELASKKGRGKFSREDVVRHDDDLVAKCPQATNYQL